MNIEQRHLQIIALVMFVVAIKFFIDHRKKKYKGVYQKDGSYEDISAVKHDMTKSFFVELVPLLVFGLATGEKFFDPDDFLGSWVGKTTIVVISYFMFYELIQPYIVTRLPDF